MPNRYNNSIALFSCLRLVLYPDRRDGRPEVSLPSVGPHRQTTPNPMLRGGLIWEHLVSIHYRHKVEGVVVETTERRFQTNSLQ